MSGITVVSNTDQLARAAADELQSITREAVRDRGVCRIALSGGSTPKYLFQQLVALGRDALPWDSIDLWWGDERTVPPDHKDSNYGMAKQHLLDPLKIDPARVHRMEGERDPEAAAADYERALCAAAGIPPVLDYNLLGMGKDGHTASLFPGSPALTEMNRTQKTRWVIANPIDSPLAGGKTTRITITFHTIAAARHTRLLVAGEDKADALAGVLEGPPGRYPSQFVGGADVRWIVDDAAASKLRRRS
ncbi:MAG TPA: 6-phosphogluconolactonase [Kofleriaceae bacterium]|nr:6-phosphogluconolactonase [Kofleriaceae bacterium]